MLDEAWIDEILGEEDEEQEPELHTIRAVYELIKQGDTPWVALGDFLNDYFDYYPAYRQQLVEEAIQLPEIMNDEQRKWAAICAAGVELLSAKYHERCPEWVDNPRFILDRPYYKDDVEHEDIRESLRQETPEPLARRNVYLGDRDFKSKREAAAEFREKMLRLKSA